MVGRSGTWTSWLLAFGLTTVASSYACRSGTVDPEALFSEAELQRLAYENGASHRAILEYRAAQAAWTRNGDHMRAAMAGQMLGATYEQLGLLDDALRSYLEAASLCRDSCDPLLDSAIASDLGLVQAKLADNDDSLQSALHQCDRALSLARQAGGVREEARARICAGEVEYHRGGLEEALELYREAEIHPEGVADRSGQAERLFHEGAVRSDLSQFVQAKTNLEEARSLWISLGNRRGEAIALVALGRIERRQNKYQEALNYFRRGLDRLEPAGDLVWEASGLAGIGNVYFDMGDPARARSNFEAALERIRKTGLQAATWDLLLVVGKAHLLLDDPSGALQRFQEALALAEKMKSDRWKAYSFHFVGLAYRSIGNLDESLNCLKHALQLQQSARDLRLEAAIQTEMGNTYELRGRLAQASASFRRALELNRDSRARMGQATALFGMARIAERSRDLDAARRYLERSLGITESLWASVDSRELRTSYFASVHRFHELYVDVLMRLAEMRPHHGLAAAAFEASERSRARSLLESLIESGVDIRAGVDTHLLEREAALNAQLDALVERRVHATDEDEMEDLDRKIRDLEAAYDLVLAEIRSKSPRYAALARREPLGLGEVQQRLLDDDTLLLEYQLGENRSFLWALSKDDYASFELGPRAEIEGEAERLYELLTARTRVGEESLQERHRRLEQADREYWEASARLSDRLLGPVAERLAGKKIVVVADGALQHLPFAALPIPGSDRDPVPMIVAHEIINLPSASTLAFLRRETSGRKRPKGAVAVFADPVFTLKDPRLDRTRTGVDSQVSQLVHDRGFLWSGASRISRLKATRQEAAAIVAVAPEGTTYRAIDFDASRSAAMRADLAQYRVLHFATHGVSNVEDPAMSGILLSMFDRRGRAQDGFLRLNDIYDLNLSADLVVLSACNTALGKQIRGEGIVGIVRAFMYAGAKRVVATLWKVDDDATRELMSRFYREMFDAHRSPSAALRSAQLAMWRESEWRSPFFWAAFVLQGEWRED